MRRGLYITFEGIDGSGKTTQRDLLAEKLTSLGTDIICTREPGGSPAGDLIRHILLHATEAELHPKAEMYLFLANRVNNLFTIIIPAIEKGQIVLSDRHKDSSIAFQGSGRGLGLEFVDEMQKPACPIEPDLTLLYDITPDESLRRTQRRNGEQSVANDRFEREAQDFRQKVYDGYHWLAKKYPKRIAVINAMPSIELVHQATIELLKNRFPKYFANLI